MSAAIACVTTLFVYAAVRQFLDTKRSFVAAAMFAYAPVAINNVAYQSTMLLVQKIFYFHFATWMAMTAAIAICGV